MDKNGFFFSLKWKIALLVGGIFLLLHSVFSYLVYLDARDDLVQNRQNIQSRYKNIAHALTKDSFLMLEQFAELFSVIESSKEEAPTQIIATLNKNWQQWQFIWGFESVVFYNQKGVLLNQWGSLLKPDSAQVTQVLRDELPNHQILCPGSCFQFVLIPLIANTELIGSLGVSRSFADTIIEYQRATDSDLGILVKSEDSSIDRWPYKISVLTHAKRNHEIINQAMQRYTFEQLVDQLINITDKGETFEMSVFPINAGKEQTGQSFFLVMDEISDELYAINKRIQMIWIYGIFGLILSLIFLLVIVVFSLSRVAQLSHSLPLLAQQRYKEFRQQAFKDKPRLTSGHDELDVLNHTAMILTDQLEGLGREIKSSIQKLIEQGDELTAERDFIQQLIDVAPILVLTQDTSGRILSINPAGIDEFSRDESLIVGSMFDTFIADIEVEHIKQLKKIRCGEKKEYLKIDGVILLNPKKKRYISWIHSCIKSTNSSQEPIILTLGVDISERKQAEIEMFKMATKDQLTKLGNRHNFQQAFNRELSIAKRYNTPLALFYLDLDQFKIVNDNSGHQAGDRLLSLVAKNLNSVVREADILSRIGGDEFTLIMPNTDEKGIIQVADKINKKLMTLEFKVDEKIYKTSCSIGIALYPQHGKDMHELLSNADLAMYQAKKTGRGQYHLFSLENDYQSELTNKLHWKDIIEEALSNDRFMLLYQPILDLKTAQISHYECLTRIKSKEGNILMPGDFIAVAEDLGLIGQIDRRVLKKAIEQHIKFKKQGKNIKLAVNLSGQSFNDTGIFDDIAKLLNVPEVEPEQIIFEITETAAVSNFSAAQDLIEQIKGLGCALALDDFGVGFSSFYYLKHLPVDYVKIDGSFIKNIAKSFEDKVFVKALTEVSQALGKKTVAEFVENETILQVLREFGIDYAQGYHIGKPDKID
ncbi:MAG: EAL domain-containing protein [Methylococcales symbiont of Hymedesmia sp. n. MRB-2018]|nr:MAG: EAL domain-containing protein [Methylococcales symbiont of Hymedesmia sp. n. MRB-2018]